MPEEPANVNVTSALPDDVRESVAAANFKALGDGAAFYANLAMGNAVANQQANQLSGQTLQQLSLTILAKATDLVTEKQIEEGGVLASAFQQLSKMAGNTPPVTP